MNLRTLTFSTVFGLISLMYPLLSLAEDGGIGVREFEPLCLSQYIHSISFRRCPAIPIDLLFYDASKGEGEFWTTDDGGGISRLGSTLSGLRKSWTAITPGFFNEDRSSDLLFYDASKGEGEFWTTNGRGGISRLGSTLSGWRKSWAAIIPGDFNGDGASDFFFYDASKGEGEFWATDGRGRMSRLGSTLSGLRKSWTAIIPGFFDGDRTTDLLFYDASKGEGEFWTIDGRGRISRLGSTLSGLRKSWATIIPGFFDEGRTTDLLFYDASKGEGEFWTTDGRGGISRLGSTLSGWRKSWTSIIPGDFNSDRTTDLLFYDASKGEGEFWTTNSRGGISRLSSTLYGWRKSWTTILSGSF